MSMRILIVDDNAVVRSELANVIQLLGNVTVAGEAVDGRDALRQCERIHPDVVLMDLEMPELDGFEATRQIKARHLARAVVVLTVYDSQTNYQKAFAAGADAFVVKGSDLNTLAEIFEQLATRSMGSGDELSQHDKEKSK